MTENGAQIGQEVEWQVLSSAIGPPGTVGNSFFRYGQGIDECKELVDYGSDLGLITKGGAWYTMTYLGGENPPKYCGKENTREAIIQNPEWQAKLRKDIMDTLGMVTKV